MITQIQMVLARKNLLTASSELRFQIITPFKINFNGTPKEIFALIPEYGSPSGTIIELISSPKFNIDLNLKNWATLNKYYFSSINIDCILDYNKDFIIET